MRSQFFFIKAILSGHDMVLIESAAWQTEKLWKDIVKFSCKESELAESFRERVIKSYDRILLYKENNKSLAGPIRRMKKDDIQALVEGRKGIEMTCRENFNSLEKIINQIKLTP